MSNPLHVCIHGAGGLGSVVGAFLARAGHRVTLIARRPHVEAIRADGLKLDGVRATFVQRDNLEAVTTPDEVQGEIDFYILLVKGKDTETALADAAQLVARTACAVSLQNGIGKEERLCEAFGRERVIGGSIMEGATLVGPGEVLNHMGVPITAYFGELGGGESDRTRAIAEALDGAGLGARSTPDIEHVLWEKLVQVGSASAWSASALGSLPELDFLDGLRIRRGAEHYIAIVRDLLSVYHALGYRAQNFYAPVSRLKEVEALDFDAAVDDMLALTERLSGRGRVRTSMHEDLLAGRKMEVEEILGPLVAAAERLGLQVPTFLAAYRVLTTLNAYLPRAAAGGSR